MNQRADVGLPGYLVLEARDERASGLSDLPAEARAEVGTILARAEAALTDVLGAQQVHVSRWGHAAGFSPHFHLIPITEALVRAFEADGRFRALAALRGFGPDDPPDGPELDLFVTRVFGESALPPTLPGPDIPEAVSLLRERLARDVSA